MIANRVNPAVAAARLYLFLHSLTALYAGSPDNHASPIT
jgi:hypothetical protein